jgi:hypothetical protein
MTFWSLKRALLSFVWDHFRSARLSPQRYHHPRGYSDDVHLIQASSWVNSYHPCLVAVI